MQKHPRGNTNEKGGIGKRFGALLLDGIIIGVPLAVLFAVLMTAVVSTASMGPSPGAGSSAGGGLFAAVGLLYLAAPLLGFLYFIVMEAVFGYTLGKKVMGLVVVDDDGGQIGWAGSIIRNVLRVVDGLFVYLVGVIFILLTDDEKRLGDIAGSTMVVEQA